jgi:hypothetical protein
VGGQAFIAEEHLDQNSSQNGAARYLKPSSVISVSIFFMVF